MGDRKPLILVIEDDPSVQDLLALLLTGEGYDVIKAADGLEGLVKLDRERPSLVILDLMMPNVSGDRVLQELQSDARLRGVPVLIVSGRHDVHESFDVSIGPENVFAKPLDPAALIDRVEELLGKPEVG
jgi:two-component system alkaline phosphatase synthesis response regulator PhoP